LAFKLEELSLVDVALSADFVEGLFELSVFSGMQICLSFSFIEFRLPSLFPLFNLPIISLHLFYLS
jgi:hypothetical protein